MAKIKRILMIMLVFMLAFGTLTAFANDTTDNDSSSDQESTEINESEDESATEEESDSEATDEVEEVAEVTENPLLDDSAFSKVTENTNYILKADSNTGHFIVENKRNGKVYRSFPNPDGWEEGGASQVWQSHLQSPFMFTYVEFNVRRDIVKESNFLSQGGTAEFTEIEDGFKITYTIPSMGFVIPVEVRLKDDYVETTILGDEIIDERELTEEEIEENKRDPKSRLVSVRLFPFFEAQASNKDGYLLLPDGPGVLVQFAKNRATTNNLFSERVYGEDMAFSRRASLSARQSVRMPVFGIKADEQAIFAVIEEGDAYASIVSAPSESLSQYNWVTAEHNFRFKFFQPTNRNNFAGFFTYSEDMHRTNRTIRYYFIEEEDPGYVDMAQRYRQYLMEDKGLTRLDPDENIELQISLLGGGTKKGFLWDSFLSLTTIEQATQIVKELNTSGVENMAINYYGWQRGGYEKYGGNFPVARKLGGNGDMKDFVEFAQSKGFSVYLDASSYSYNNTNKDGFRRGRDGMQDLSLTVVDNFRYGNQRAFVSPRFVEKLVLKELNKAKDLGVDGYIYGEAIGSILSTDYNERHYAERHEVKEIHENIIEKTKEELGEVKVTDGNFYGLKDIKHIDKMSNDYSYDLFVDRKVPFAQIALHGLVSYSFDYANMSPNAAESFLQGLEYGAVPSFILTYEETQKSLGSDTMSRFYSTHYKDWEKEITSWYQSYNDALRDVQDQFIVDHRMLDEGVFETTYENGKRIVVNYNNQPYTANGMTVEAEDFVVLEGGN